MNTKIGMMLALSLVVGSSVSVSLEEIQAETHRRAACGRKMRVYYVGELTQEYLKRNGIRGTQTSTQWSLVPPESNEKMTSIFVLEHQLGEGDTVHLQGPISAASMDFSEF